MTTTSCPRCGQPTIVDPAGRTLESDPHPLAIHRPDGTDLTTEDVLAGRRDGHHQHHCPPRRSTATPGQEAIF